MIMDGNGRWAIARGRPRSAGHEAGAQAVRRVVEAAPDLGIRALTLYAFSQDNWNRPRAEVRILMRLFHRFLLKETENCRREGVRIRFLGRRDRLPGVLRRLMDAAERRTAAARRLDLRLAVDYSSRDSIVRAARLGGDPGSITVGTLCYLIADANDGGGRIPDVDLLIRTGGEKRLSDFLLWECAYAELYFTDVMWPDFGKHDMEEAMRQYHLRERRFGRAPEVHEAPVRREAAG
jgi:undecaprenyl diphosphate synthase